ncbi:hypothetical protein HDU78_003725 [Chytriomyces hyalinus]|nr:hypothetical protein HDU78_003725 [Chytriomyces hyalinus]
MSAQISTDIPSQDAKQEAFIDPEGGAGFAMDLGDDDYYNNSYRDELAMYEQNTDVKQSVSFAPPPTAIEQKTWVSPETAPIPNNASLGYPATYDRRRSSSSKNGASPRVPGLALSATSGNPMFGSNISIHPISDGTPNGVAARASETPIYSHANGAHVVDSPTQNVVVGFGSGQDLSLAHQETFISTNLVASYKWTIENFNSITDEKIVSPPFGSANHPWQMVIYPRGASNSDQTYLSAFLRPLKTVEEMAAKDDWIRPVRRFTFRVHKPVDVNPYSSEPEESYSYTVLPSHMDEDIPEDVLIQDTSVEHEFNGFSASVPGWGFTTLMHLDEYLTSAVDPQTGSLILSASVESMTSVPWTTQTFSWAIPQFETHLSNGFESLLSPTFGPDDSPWNINLTANYEDGQLAGFLQPVPTQTELETSSWTRSISSFTLKIASPQGEYGYTHSPSHVSVKTLTGGFIFNAANLSTGWPSLLALDQVPGCVDSNGFLRLDVEVTWISSLGAANAVVSGVDANKQPVIAGIPEEIVAQRISEVEAVWYDKYESLTGERDSLAVQLAELQQDVDEAKETISKDQERVLELKNELAASREAEALVALMTEKVKIAKSRIAALRASIEDGVSLEDGSFSDGTAANNAGYLRVVYSEQEKEEQFFVMKAKLLTVEAELEVARATIRSHHNSLFENRMFPDSYRPISPNMPPMGHSRRMSFMSESPDKPAAVEDALESGRTELDNARTALDDFAHRGEFSPDAAGQIVERAAFRADIAMVFAELSLACAALLDSAYHHEPEQLPTYNSGSEVALLASEMEQLLFNVEAQLGQLRLPMPNQYTGYAGSAFSPVSQSQQLSNAAYGVSQRERDLELQMERYKTQTEMMAAELESHKRLEMLKAQNPFDASTSPAFIKSVMSSPTAMKGLMRVHETGPVHRGRGDMYPEPWTPVDSMGGPVSAMELAKILSQLESSKKETIFNTIFMILFFLLTSFVSYATLNVHCANPSNDGLMCQFAVPVYSSVSTAWHTAAEKFVSEIVPLTSDTLAGVHKSTLKAIDNVDRKVKNNWERAERERVAKYVAEQESIAREKAAAIENEKLEEMKKWEEERMAQVERRLQERLDVVKGLEERAIRDRRRAEEEANLRRKLELERLQAEEVNRNENVRIDDDSFEPSKEMDVKSEGQDASMNGEMKEWADEQRADIRADTEAASATIDAGAVYDGSFSTAVTSSKLNDDPIDATPTQVDTKNQDSTKAIELPTVESIVANSPVLEVPSDTDDPEIATATALSSSATFAQKPSPTAAAPPVRGGPPPPPPPPPVNVAPVKTAIATAPAIAVSETVETEAREASTTTTSHMTISTSEVSTATQPATSAEQEPTGLPVSDDSEMEYQETAKLMVAESAVDESTPTAPNSDLSNSDSVDVDDEPEADVKTEADSETAETETVTAPEAPKMTEEATEIPSQHSSSEHEIATDAIVDPEDAKNQNEARESETGTADSEQEVDELAEHEQREEELNEQDDLGERDAPIGSSSNDEEKIVDIFVLRPRKSRQKRNSDNDTDRRAMVPKQGSRIENDSSRDLPVRAIQQILKHIPTHMIASLLVVNRRWLQAGAGLLYRILDPTNQKIAATLLDGNAMLPYAMLVRAIRFDGEFDSEKGGNGHVGADLEMGDVDTLIQLCPMLTSFSFNAVPMASNILAQSLADNAHRLTHLSLRECPITDLLIKTLCNSCRKLSTVDLSYSLVTVASAVTLVESLPNITKLVMEGAAPSQAPVSFSPLETFTRPLKTLNLKNSGASDVHVRFIALACPQLATIRLEGCSSLTDDCIIRISQSCSNLETLDLSLVSLITDLSLYSIIQNCHQSQSVRNLSLSGCVRLSTSIIQLLINTLCGKAVSVPLQFLALHGCTNIINSYLVKFDSSRSEELECMFNAVELQAAVGAQPPELMSPTTSTASTRVNDYAIDSNELWMLAAYNTRILDAAGNGKYSGMDTLSEVSSNNRSGSLASLDTITPSMVLEPGSAGGGMSSSLLSTQTLLHLTEGKKEFPDTSKRVSTNSNLSIASSSGSGSRVSRLPAPSSGSKLPASKLRQSATIKAVATGLMKPGSSIPGPRSRIASAAPSAAATATPTKTPTKINFAASTSSAAASRVSSVRPTTNRLSMNSGSYAAPRLSSTPTANTSQTNGYKPRSFKKFNDGEFGEGVSATPVKSPASRANSSSVKPGSMSATASSRRPATLSAASKATTSPAVGSGASSRLVGGTVPPSVMSSRYHSDSAVTTVKTGGLDRYRSSTAGAPNVTSPESGSRASADSPLSAGSSGMGLDRYRRASIHQPKGSENGGLDKWRKPPQSSEGENATNWGSASMGPSVNLDRWRKSAETVDNGGGGSSNIVNSLDKWRKPASSEDLSGNVAPSGLDRWRKSTSVGAPSGGSRLKGPSTGRK